MKLSEAILLGSTISLHCRSLLIMEYADGQVAACAYGAAGVAIGDRSYGGIERAFPWVMKVHADCPECGINTTAQTAIIHLNDHHGWTRERIAEWVASIEPKAEEAKPEGREEYERTGSQAVPVHQG